LLARVASGVVLALVSLSCCLTGGWHECDSSTYEGHCDGNRYSYCLWSGGSWSGEYEELLEGECAANEICVEPRPGAPVCIGATSRPCDPASFVERCEPTGVVRCSPPSSYVSETYEVWGPPCGAGSSCTVVDGHAACVGAP
jgi:hypothetical protein